MVAYQISAFKVGGYLCIEIPIFENNCCGPYGGLSQFLGENADTQNPFVEDLDSGKIGCEIRVNSTSFF